MKKNVYRLFIFALIFSSCSHVYYIPTVQNVPLNTGKNEFKISGHYGSWFNWSTESFDIQSSYSVTDQIGLMLNGLYSNVKEYGDGGYVEGALGYYKPVYKKKLFKNTDITGVFEIYGGLGVGKQHHNYENGYADISGTKVFIQPSFGITTNFLDLIFSSRICTTSFKIIENQNVDISYAEDINFLVRKGHNFIEPAVTLRAGWESIKLQIQVQPSINLNKSEEHYIDDGGKCSLGIVAILP